MCFSLGASFGAGVILGTIAVVAIAKAGTSPKRLFTVIPLLFSIQQFSEGLMWIALTDSSYAVWQQFSIHIFLLFAYVIWPVWIPLTILLLEKNRKRQTILKFLLAAGIGVSLYISILLLLYPVHASVTEHHIQYKLNFPPVILHFTWLSDMFYFIAVIAAPFVSTVKKMWIVGFIIAISYLISKFYLTTL